MLTASGKVVLADLGLSSKEAFKDVGKYLSKPKQESAESGTDTGHPSGAEADNEKSDADGGRHFVEPKSLRWQVASMAFQLIIGRMPGNKKDKEWSINFSDEE